MKHIVHLITGLQRGGAETVLVTLCKELAGYGHRQSVIFFKGGPLEQELQALGIATYHVGYITLFSTIKKLNPDCIHSLLWSANILARIIGKWLQIPTYCALHTVSEHSGKLRNILDIVLPVHAQKYIAVSETVATSYKHIVPAQKIVIIENGIPLRGTQVQEKNSEVFTIGTVGRFVPVKNYALLLQATAKLYQEYKNIRLILVGHGPLENELRALTQQLGIQDIVTFVINQPAHAYYVLFDCFVQPSAYEGLSIALLEALQAHLPVIVTGQNHQHTCITHKKNGLVVKPNHVETLYSALKEYLLDHPTAQLYAQAGYQHVQENFSATAMAQKYHHLFCNN